MASPVRSSGGAFPQQPTFVESDVKTSFQSPAPVSGGGPLLSPAMVAELDRARSLGLKPWMLAFQERMPELPPDTQSNAEQNNAVTTHLHWKVTPDFRTKQLNAVATYNYSNKKAGNDCLVLDTKDLVIKEILVNGQKAAFEIVISTMGCKPDALRITIPPQEGPGVVAIEYSSSEASTGVFWVDKEYTSSQKHPLMYTLFQPNEGASAIPGQHSPGIRMTYEVDASTGSSELMALSSVMNNPKERTADGHYSGLKMGRAVPLYLLSLNVGNFAYRGYKEDPRTGVYSEEVMLDAVTEAFSYLPRALRSAETICGPYQWKEYNAVLLSKGFPYMAMEHPCASTFGQICMERPTVIPHELAHSWTGNDITNCNWRQFFWNEGATCFLEYKIAEKLHGADSASVEFLYLLDEMKAAMDEYREKRPDLLRLCQETDDVEFTRIPYGKGALFFFMLENAMGAENFDLFFKDYMRVFYQNSMSDERFLEFLRLWLRQERGVVDFDKFKKDHLIEEWLYGLEIPANAPHFQSKLMNAILEQKDRLLKGQPIDQKLISGWDIPMQINFLSSLVDSVKPQQLELLDRQMGFTQSQVMSIREEWSRLCACAGYINPDTKASIASYVIERNSKHKANQVCAALSKTPEGQAVIAHILEQDGGRLFPLVRAKVAEFLLK